eukprot:3971784-Amphidinium_carterae.1
MPDRAGFPKRFEVHCKTILETLSVAYMWLLLQQLFSEVGLLAQPGCLHKVHLLDVSVADVVTCERFDPLRKASPSKV